MRYSGKDVMKQSTGTVIDYVLKVFKIVATLYRFSIQGERFWRDERVFNYRWFVTRRKSELLASEDVKTLTNCAHYKNAASAGYCSKTHALISSLLSVFVCLNLLASKNELASFSVTD